MSPDKENPAHRTHSLVTDKTAYSVRSLSLEIAKGTAAGERFAASSSLVQIGSHPRCDFVVEDPTVSRFHCELEIDENGAHLRDCGSRNGTKIDGIPVLVAPLRHGSRIELGNAEILVSFGIENQAISVSEAPAFGEMQGETPTMRAVFSRLEKAAASDATLVIEGETGTGKTMAARSIHAESSRAGKPFVAFDCGAIAANLIESELFGHERGAFTGATEARKGALEEANGGTIFLDEIGELPLALQPKLLGALEERTLRRVGSSTPIQIDVRVIAATNRNLRAEVNSGGFRSDLYYRLAVLEIRLPPLRERQADIPALARVLLEKLGGTRTQIDALLSGDPLKHICRGAWLGNVRELRNYLERCLVLDEMSPVPSETPPSTEAGDVDHELPFADAKKRANDAFERRYLSALLERHDKVSSAAAAAQIDRTYFYRLLRRHKISV